MHQQQVPSQNNTAQVAWRKFRSFLRERNERITEARRIILAQIISHTDHFRAEDIADDLRSGPQRVSRATVYRTLTLLVEAGLVRQIQDSPRGAYYESCLDAAHHEHMVCSKCGQFIEFAADALAAQINDICREHNFTHHTHQLVVYGLCNTCSTG